MGYLNKVPVLRADVGQGLRLGAQWFGQGVSDLTEQFLYRTGGLMYAVEPTFGRAATFAEGAATARTGADNIALFARYREELVVISEPRDYLAKFELIPRADGSLRYKTGNLNKAYGIDAVLSAEGSLSLEVQASNAALRARLGSGTDMYDNMMRRVGVNNVKQIEGIWSRGSGLTTNLDSFEATFARTGDEYLAAAQTWSGRRAASYGFVPVDVQMAPNNVRVIFGRR